MSSIKKNHGRNCRILRLQSTIKPSSYMRHRGNVLNEEFLCVAVENKGKISYGSCRICISFLLCKQVLTKTKVPFAKFAPSFIILSPAQMNATSEHKLSNKMRKQLRIIPLSSSSEESPNRFYFEIYLLPRFEFLSWWLNVFLCKSSHLKNSF